MFSKRGSFFKYLGVFSVAVILSACGLKIGEAPIPEGEVPLDGYSCVNQISQKASLYFEDKMNDAEIIEFMDCLKKSVSDFPKRMRSENGIYNPESLRDFINRIVKGRELTPELLQQFMKLKQTFVGGRVDQISRQDLSAALNLIEDLKKAALILRPHVKVFNSSLGEQIPAGKIAMELDKASEALKEASRIFLVSLKKTERSYSLKDFEKLLEEFRDFIDWNRVFPTARSSSAWTELIASAKEISTGGDRYEIKQGEWESFLSLAGSAYIAYLKIKYGVVGQNLWMDVGLKNLVHVVDQVRDEVIRVISSRKNRLLPKDEVGRLLESLEGLGWMPFGLDAETASRALELVATKILDNGFHGPFLGFRMQHVLKAANEFESWASTQSYLSSRMVKDKETQKSAPQVFVSMNDGGEDSALNKNEFVPEGWVEFTQFLSARRPLFMPNSFSVALDYAANLNQSGVKFDLHNLSATHLFYRVLKLVFESYGRRDQSGEFHLSGPSLQHFYTDFYSLGVALRWLDSRATTAGSRSYIEGNLFTYDSNGLGKEYGMDLSEGVDLIAYLLTAGRLTDSLYEYFSFCEHGPKDFRGDLKISRSCVEKNLVAALEKKLTLAPQLQSWIGKLNLKEGQKYSGLLLQSAFSKENSDTLWLEKTELSTLSVVILYSESVMTRYDGDHDGVLSDKEVDVAFPVFKEFINSFSLKMISNSWLASYLLTEDGRLTDGALHSIFEFILFNKKAPQSSGDLLSVYWNAVEEPSWEVHSDRMDLTESFSVIINGLLNPPSAPKESEAKN